MSDEFRLTIEALAKEYNRQAAQLRQAYTELSELAVTAESRDRMVSVTVGPRGQVQGIKLDPRVYRKLSPSQLARSIMEQIGAATEQVAGRTKELMAPFMPAGLPLEDVFGEGASVESFLPQPVKLPSEEDEEEGARG
ncbi:YbaB/EbfC family nucleoid-associated protein [Actinomadura sp. ATCC 31491]|uniref:YbaB/EbfC family nucleoid-associated protein n=1 Tax=Actinomadura luzonensis TaxID=2805427 RepID=A0ABT0FQZ9_9ACTN|nr:YbaB/EbfC family nucleoid-associated protein [Actinomadura luzonensis]MCK2214694.1 YbaB/EbfC family nucleoid-associated protein [Actinomadura luzonensis]